MFSAPLKRRSNLDEKVNIHKVAVSEKLQEWKMLNVFLQFQQFLHTRISERESSCVCVRGLSVTS